MQGPPPISPGAVRPRILLVSTNRETFPEPAFPLGAAYVEASLERAGAEVRIFDAGLHRRPERALALAVREWNPAWVGLSIRNVDNVCYPFTKEYLPEANRLVQTIRTVSGVPILVGGAGFALFPEDILRELDVDSGVVGDGEAGALAFLKDATPGLRRSSLEDLRSVSFPSDPARTFPGFRKYRTIGIQTARGCPHACIYCTYPALEGRCLRKRSPDAVASEMARLARDFGKRDFFVVDSSFNADESHMASVLEALLATGERVRFACYLEPRMRDPALFGLLARAGCTAVDFGTDSGAPAVLRNLRKGFGQEHVAQASDACRKAGLAFCHSLVFGGPEESEETVRETVRLMDACGPKAVMASVGLRVYPGTELEALALRDGIIREGESLLRPRFYFGGNDPDALLSMVRTESEGRRNWFFPGERDWGTSWFLRLLRFLYRRGPLWKTLPPGKKVEGSDRNRGQGTGDRGSGGGSPVS